MMSQWSYKVEGESQHWSIVFAAFLTQALTHGFVAAMGVFYVEWKQAFAEDSVGSGTIGWLATSVFGVMLSTAPVSGALTDHFGVRPVVMFGGFLSASGIFITSFAQSISLLYFTVPVLIGLGCGLSYAPSVTIVTQYFLKHFALANGIASTGISCGVILLPVAAQALVDYYTWRNALMIMAAMQAHIIVCGALMKPPHGTFLRAVDQIDIKLGDFSIQHSTDSKSSEEREMCADDTRISSDGNPDTSNRSIHVINKTSQLREILDTLGISLLWTNRVYLCFLPAFLFGATAFQTIVIYIKERAVKAGIPEFQSAFLISILGISSFVSRTGHGHLIDKHIVHVITLYCFAMFTSALVIPFIAISEHYAAFVICAWFVGFSAGLYISLEFVIMKRIVGVERFPGGMGIAMVLLACSAMSAATLAGYLLDTTGDHFAGFLFASISQVVAGIIALLNHVMWTWCIKDPRWPPRLSSGCGINEAG